MTLNDFLKRIKAEDMDKTIIYSDGKGWENISFKITDTDIIIYGDENPLFFDDKER